MINLRGIEKSFPHGPTRTYVLRRIDVDIKAGEFVSIMGPSGAGKSTLLHILGMHDQSWSGEYYFDDTPVHTLDGKKRAALRNRNIGFVFQSYHLLDDQTVFENLELPLSYRDVSKKDRQSIVCDTLDRFQMVARKIFSQLNFQAVNSNWSALPVLLLPVRGSSSPTSQREIFIRPGQGDHGDVQAAERRRHDDRSGHALGNERLLWQSHYSSGRRLDSQSGAGAEIRSRTLTAPVICS